MILCNRHYSQLYKHGKIFKRTIYDKNEIVKYEHYAEVFLYDKYGNVKIKTLIDLDDVSRVGEYKWTYSGVYAKNEINDIYLHSFLLGYYENQEIDHINRDKLDNRKQNLRFVSHLNNSKNISIPKDNKTGFIGVIWDKERKKWRAEITANKISKHLGRYDDIDMAIKARLAAEAQYFGEFAPQKHLFDKYNIPN